MRTGSFIALNNILGAESIHKTPAQSIITNGEFIFE
jgi:hypothetical protein